MEDSTPTNKQVVPMVAFVPIRLNSKRVKAKNVRLLGGRPLFCWTLEKLDTLGIPVYIYTNGTAILANRLDFQTKNIMFLSRPVGLDEDETKGIEIYRSFRNDVKSDAYLLAHCTSPFVHVDTYKRAITAVTEKEANSAATVAKIQTFCWHEGKPINFTIPRERTQNIKPIYVETSAAYCYKRGVLDAGDRTTMNCELIETSPCENIDIDTEEDWKLAEIYARSVK